MRTKIFLLSTTLCLATISAQAQLAPTPPTPRLPPGWQEVKRLGPMPTYHSRNNPLTHLGGEPGASGFSTNMSVIRYKLER